MSDTVDTPRRLDFDLRLRSTKSTRQSFARILRGYARGEIDEQTFKSLVWALNQYTGLLKLQTEEDLIKRMDEIEKQMENHQ